MRGGAGNDVYVVDNAGDIVNESLAGSNGIDTVQSSISFSLANTARVLGAVENLTLLGTGNINGTGNALNNVLTGNAGTNVLERRRPARQHARLARQRRLCRRQCRRHRQREPRRLERHRHRPVVDQLQPGQHGARARLGREPDAARLRQHQRHRQCPQQRDHRQCRRQRAERRRLARTTCAAGAGNDVYVVDNAGDIVNESLAGSNGIDTVQSSISFSLANTARVLGAVENLTLLGSGNINGTGNALNNVITGNAGANVLNGAAGNDT